MAKDLENTILFDVYGSLLTEKQRETLEFYYNDDLSLGEISEETGITRQGVMNCIKTSEARLAELEEQMGLVGKFRALKASVERLEKAVSDEKADTPEITGIIEEIKALL